MSTSRPWESAWWTRTVLRAVTEEANELTMSRTRTAPPEEANVPSARRHRPMEAAGHRRQGVRWPPRRPVGNNGPAMNVVVCVKQIPDPAAPGALDPSTNTLKREGKLILDESDSYGVEMALQLVAAAGEGEVSLVSMAPNGETAGLRTALAMGAAQGRPRVRPRAAGLGRAHDGEGAGQGGRAPRRRRPRDHRHGVDGRVHGHRARADRRAPRPALGHLRQARRGRRRLA